MSSFASPAALQELTGLTRPSAIRRWLNLNGIPYLVGVDRWPRVLESAILSRLGGAPAPTSEPKLHLRHG